MVKVSLRKSSDRGYVDHGWLNSFHTFSFADYYDSDYMGFRSLRVINDDTIAPSKGFETHSHQNMEIISFVIQGALEHQDSMGNGSVISEGCVQRITAGQGITHSEFNHSKKDFTRFLQIWIKPKTLELEPNYVEINLNDLKMCNGLKLIGSLRGKNGSIVINQDVFLLHGQGIKEEVINYSVDIGRGIWIQVIKGHLLVLDHNLLSGDGLSVENVNSIEIKVLDESEFLLFDLG